MSTSPGQPSPIPTEPYLAPPLNVPPIVWMILKWSALGLGGLLALIATVIESGHAPALAVFGLFFAIAARIMQAEEHRAK